MNITVFLGANYSKDEKINHASIELGKYIALHHHTLVYGGSNSGLMHSIADSCKKSGGKIIGVQAKMFDDKQNTYPLCDEIHIFDNLKERKDLMIQLADAFIALPGGTGTLDEISEVMCVDKLASKHRPVILLNINGFYEDLKHQLDKMTSFGFLSTSDRNLILFIDEVKDLDSALKI